jgi:hypothetical protein
MFTVYNKHGLQPKIDFDVYGLQQTIRNVETTQFLDTTLVQILQKQLISNKN